MSTELATYIASGIAFTGNILAALITVHSNNKPKKPDNDNMKDIDHSKNISYVVENHTYIQKSIISKDNFNDIINEASEKFEKLLEDQSIEIIKEMNRIQVKDTIIRLKSHVENLQTLLTIKIENNNPYILTDLVQQSLNPLQIELGITNQWLREPSKIREYCNLVANSTLLAGYAFLGMEAPHIKKVLEESLKSWQLSILNETALEILSNNKTFPWNNVSHFLLPEGAEKLANLYKKTLEEKRDKEKSIKEKRDKERKDKLQNINKNIKNKNIYSQIKNWCLSSFQKTKKNSVIDHYS